LLTRSTAGHCIFQEQAEILLLLLLLILALPFITRFDIQQNRVTLCSDGIVNANAFFEHMIILSTLGTHWLVEHVAKLEVPMMLEVTYILHYFMLCFSQYFLVPLGNKEFPLQMTIQ
jgi:hypothetical protein